MGKIYIVKKNFSWEPTDNAELISSIKVIRDELRESQQSHLRLPRFMLLNSNYKR